MRKFSFLILISFFLLVPFLYSGSVLFPFGTPMYLPFSFSSRELLFIPVKLDKTGMKKIGNKVKETSPDVLLISVAGGLKAVKEGKLSNYSLKYVVMWKAGTLLVLASNPELKKVLVGCKNNYKLLKFYSESEKLNFKISFVPYPKIFQLIMTGYRGSFVEVEPFTSMILTLYKGQFVPFVDLAEYVSRKEKFKFPVDGLPLSGIFVKKGDKEAEKVARLLTKRARVINKEPAEYSKVVSMNIKRYFKMSFPPDVISEALISKRVFFAPVEVKEIKPELQRFFKFFKSIK